jgi:hypothetical protein
MLNIIVFCVDIITNVTNLFLRSKRSLHKVVKFKEGKKMRKKLMVGQEGDITVACSKNFS